MGSLRSEKGMGADEPMGENKDKYKQYCITKKSPSAMEGLSAFSRLRLCSEGSNGSNGFCNDVLINGAIHILYVSFMLYVAYKPIRRRLCLGRIVGMEE